MTSYRLTIATEFHKTWADCVSEISIQFMKVDDKNFLMKKNNNNKRITLRRESGWLPPAL